MNHLFIVCPYVSPCLSVCLSFPDCLCVITVHGDGVLTLFEIDKGWHPLDILLSCSLYFDKGPKKIRAYLSQETCIFPIVLFNN